jgi:hypothetical protein
MRSFKEDFVSSRLVSGKSIGVGIATARVVVGLFLAISRGQAGLGGLGINDGLHNYSRLSLPLKLNYVNRRYMTSTLALPATSSAPSPVKTSKLPKKGFTKRISVPRATMEDFVTLHRKTYGAPSSLKFIQDLFMLCERDNIKIPVTVVSTLTDFSRSLDGQVRLDRNSTDHELLSPITDIFFQLFKDCESTLDVLNSITELSKKKMLRYLIHALDNKYEYFIASRDTLKLEELIKLPGSPRKKSKRLIEYFDKRLNTKREYEPPTDFAKDFFAMMYAFNNNR